MKKSFEFYRDLVILCLISVPLGAVSGAVCAIFGIGLLKITEFRTVHYLFLLPFLGAAGAFLLFAYDRFGGDSAKGMSLMFEVDQETRKKIPLRLVPMVILATWTTHLFGGSAGREGVAVQIGGTLGCWTGSRLPVKNAHRLLMVAGMAGGFGGLFRTPMAAAFFAAEVFSAGTLEYSALLPAITASYTACWVSGAMGLEKFSFPLREALPLNAASGVRIVILGIAFGLTGMLFSWLLKFLKTKFAVRQTRPFIFIAVSGTLIGLTSIMIFGGRYSGLGTNLISAGFTEDILPWDFILKLLFTVITLASGFFGGEVTPLFSIGVSLGFVLAAPLGLPVTVCAALGYAAVFGSATNTVIAPMLIGAEVFGFSYLPLFFIVCAVAYMCNGSFSIYSMQKTFQRHGKV